MKETAIKVLMVEPGKEPKMVELKNTLMALQEAVSIGAEHRGLIEILPLDDVCILCNEEAKLIGLECNRRFYNDILCGVFYVTGQDKSGNLCSLTPTAMEYYKNYFADLEIIAREEVEKTFFTAFYIV